MAHCALLQEDFASGTYQVRRGAAGMELHPLWVDMPRARNEDRFELLPRAELLDSKLKPLRVAAATIERDCVLAAIDQATQKKLTVIVAPAGSGKTTLLTQWHRRAGADRAIAWLSVEEIDNDPPVAFSYLLAALVEAIPSFSMQHMACGSRISIARFNARLLRGLCGFAKPLVIVLDDFQHLTHPGIVRALHYLLMHSPENVRWIIVTRRLVDLPLSEFKLGDQLTVLRSDQLAFTVNDINALNVKLHGAELPVRDAEWLRETTGGWIAGAKLALGSAAGTPNIGEALRRFTGCHHEVRDYMTSVLWRDVPPEMLGFVLASAVVDEMNAELCDALCGGCGGEQMFDRLEQLQFFLQPLDRDRRWYCYQPLVRDFLRCQLLRDNPGEVPELHRRASRWFADRQRNEEALLHAFATDDRAWCIDITARCAASWLRIGQTTDILRWARRLTWQEILSNEDLSCAVIFSFTLARRFNTAAAMLRKARRRVPNDDLTSRSRLNLLEFLSRVDTADNVAAAEEPLLLDEEGDAYFLSISMAAHASRLLQRCRFDAAIRVATRARELVKSTNNMHAMSYVETLICVAERARGNFKQALHTCERNFEVVSSEPNSAAWVNAAVALAWTRYEQYRFNEAEELCKQVLPYVLTASTSDNFVATHIVLARLLWRRNQSEQSLQTLDYAYSMLEADGHPRFLAQLCFEKLLLRFQLNCLDGARAVARDFGLPHMVRRGEWEAAREYDDAWGRFGLATALLWMHEERYHESSALLQVLLRSAQATGYVYRQLALSATLAVCRFRAGDSRRAMELLIECLAPNLCFGFGAATVDEIPGLESLIRAAHATGRLAGVRLPKGMEHLTDGTAGSPASPIGKALTEREVEILRLVSKGFCNKTISKTSSIAINTTKWHLRNAFTKLGVGSRTGAIARARELKLID